MKKLIKKLTKYKEKRNIIENVANQKKLEGHIINVKDFLTKMKLTNNLTWNRVVIPNEIVEPAILPSNSGKCVKNAILPLSKYRRRKIESLNSELRKLTCMQEFTLKYKNIQHVIVVQKDNIFTILFDKPVFPKTKELPSIPLEMFMIDGEFGKISFNQTSCIAHIDVMLQLNKEGQSWAELDSIFTKSEYRGLGIATTMLAMQIELIKSWQPVLEAKGYKRISYISGLIKNFDNSLNREVLDEIYLKCDMKIEGDQCYFVFDDE